ncbi:MAG: hypothetical protein OXG46_10690 [Chloroflexi bacterium]|nr:hypothetical protein [Chloroflexota bacterium]MCY3939326.1 hypothetical protein [Chloroflexota bacterium]
MGPHDLNGGLISPSIAFHLDPPHMGQVILRPFLSEPNSLSLKLSKIGLLLPTQPRLDMIEALFYATETLISDPGFMARDVRLGTQKSECVPHFVQQDPGGDIVQLRSLTSSESS